MWVYKEGLKEARGVTMWACLCVNGGRGNSELGRVDKVCRTGVLGLVQYRNGSDEWKQGL